MIKTKIFGQQLKFLRIKKGELLKDTAKALGVSSSYLSTVENDRRKPTNQMLQAAIAYYHLDGAEKKELEEAYYQSIEKVIIKLDNISEDTADLCLLFAKKLDTLNDEQIMQMFRILNMRNTQ